MSPKLLNYRRMSVKHMKDVDILLFLTT